MATSTIKILREVNNYTQEFVAEDILGISQNTYSRLEQNPNKITAEQAQKLSELYQVSIANLLSEATPVITFKENSITNNTGSANGFNQNTTVHNNKDEVEILKEQLDYLRKQNLELLKLLGTKVSQSL
jgi:transcriptional regulator with XRE-family HTH domain